MKRDLILVPIESLTERYSEQWARNFPPAFTQAGFNVTVIDGIPLLDNEIKVGAFLDINSTVHFKMTQLQQIARMFNDGRIKPDTVFFFADIEFWGLESVRLMADMNKVPVKIAGFLHAGSYTREDAFAIAAPYQCFTEVGWVASLDKVFVGSHYHKGAFTRRRLDPLDMGTLAERIVVSSNPLFKNEYPSFPDEKKQNMVVLTNRFDSEKRPGETLALFEAAKAQHPDWRFLVCTGRPTLRSNHPELVEYARRLEAENVIEIHDGLSKMEYHRILAQAKVMVSHSIEESYGYCVVEAIHYGCIPYLREGLSHTELTHNYAPCLFSSRASVARQVQGVEYLMAETVRESVAPFLLSTMGLHYDALASIARELSSL